MSFWSELKRRHIFTAVMAYAVVAWLLVQVAAVVLPAFELPNWIFRVFLVLIGIGFIVTLVLAWIYEITAKGIKRTDSLTDEAVTAEQPGRRKVEFAAVGFLLCTAIVLLTYNSYFSEEPPEKHNARSLAVLSFANRSSDPKDAYFADGLADELVSVLSRVRELKVASRSATIEFKGKNKPISEIASTLGTENILSGSVQRDGDRIRVTVTLDRMSDGVVLWSNKYDRQLESLLDIQTDIAQAVAVAITPILSPESQSVVERRPTESPEAYDYYLRGRDYLRLPAVTATLASATSLFDRAIALDPQFAAAFAGRCDTELAKYKLTQSAAPFEAAEVACYRALTLDNSSWESHLALGNLYLASGQYEDALREYGAATLLQPNSEEPYLGIGRTYAESNRLQLAEDSFRRAADLASGNWLVHNTLGHFFEGTGRYDEAIAEYQRVIELTPDSGIGDDNLGNTYLSMGRLADAERTFSDSPLPSRWTFENLGLVYYYGGDFAKAIENERKAIEIAPDNHRLWGHLGDAYRLARDTSNATSAYARAIELADQALAINPVDYESIALLAMYLTYTGQRERAAIEVAKVDALPADVANLHGIPYYLARIAMQNGDMESAYDYLRRSIEGGWARALVLSDPDLVRHAGEARFEQL